MKRIKQKFRRDLAWEKRFGFDINTDYRAEVDRYNQLVSDHNQTEISNLLSKHNGLFCLLALASYQKGMMQGEETVIVP